MDNRTDVQFSDILYTPLDIPIQDYLPKNLMELWHKYSQPERRLVPCDSCNPEWPDCCMKEALWQGLSVYGEFLSYKEQPVTFTQPRLSEEDMKLFEPLAKALIDYGLYYKVSHIWLWESKKEIIPHVEFDNSREINGPCIFRVLIYDENPQPTFFLHHWEPGFESIPSSLNFKNSQHLERLYIRAPQLPHPFCWNNHVCLHGSTYDPKYKKILLCVTGDRSLESHKNVIFRNYEKFKNLAFTK